MGNNTYQQCREPGSEDRRRANIYIVHNLTKKTVILSDLRVEIGPRKLLDLERVTSRSAIESSRDLRQALSAHQLALAKYSAVRTNVPSKKKQDIQVIERTIVEKSLDETRLKEMIREVITETKDDGIEKKVQAAVEGGMGSLISSIRDEISNISIVGNVAQKREQEISIDPKKLAEISQASISKISEDIETGGTNKAQKINILNRSKTASDLANEL